MPTTPPTLNAFQRSLLTYLTDYLRAGNRPTTLYYRDVGRAADPDFKPSDRRFKRISTALHAINLHEAYYGRPLPGAMVVADTTGQPGRGFYPSAAQAGREFDNDWPGPRAAAYWREELAALVGYWTAPERLMPEETQLDRIESKLDKIIAHLGI